MYLYTHCEFDLSKLRKDVPIMLLLPRHFS